MRAWTTSFARAAETAKIVFGTKRPVAMAGRQRSERLRHKTLVSKGHLVWIFAWVPREMIVSAGRTPPPPHSSHAYTYTSSRGRRRRESRRSVADSPDESPKDDRCGGTPGPKRGPTRNRFPFARESAAFPECRSDSATETRRPTRVCRFIPSDTIDPRKIESRGTP